MTEDAHEITLELSQGFVSLTCKCPYARDDRSRPCWPHHDEWNEALGGEESVPDTDEFTDCTYESWIDNEGIDLVVGPDLLIPLRIVEMEWDDAPKFTLALASEFGLRETNTR